MAYYVMRRLLLLPVILLGITAVAFSLMYLIPGDPAALMAGPEANQEEIEALRVRLGLDRPPILRYLEYVWRAAHFDLGTSLRTREPVIHAIMARLPNTLMLAGIAISLSVFFGILAGVVAAIKHQTAVDDVVMVLSLLGVSTPAYWLALMLMLLFAVQLGWLPVAGKGDWRYAVLPSLTLAARATGEIARMSRADMLEVLREDYLRTARAKGLAEWTVISSHALKNALIPTITVIGLRFGGLLGGTVLTETIFAWPGVGRLVVDAIAMRDFPMVQGAVLVIAANFVLVNLAVDLAYGLLDPRIRYR